MRFDKRRKKFRSILNGDRCVYPGSVFDPISARIAEDIGFEIECLQVRLLLLPCWEPPML
jgi:2-methylisocitrate lyase-like PEP mutase family enzyme